MVRALVTRGLSRTGGGRTIIGLYPWHPDLLVSQTQGMDLDLVHHALAAARRHGYAEVELADGEGSFTAKLARAPKAKAAPAPSEGAASVDDAPKPLKATLVGYFRHAKAPLEVGRTVKRGEVVGMIEALGIVTEVTSNVEGEVVEILVEPGQAVEYGQALAKVKG